MEKVLFDELSKVQVPFKEVKHFMRNLEDGLINSDNTDFYKYLEDKDNFEHIFKKYQ